MASWAAAPAPTAPRAWQSEGPVAAGSRLRWSCPGPQPSCSVGAPPARLYCILASSAPCHGMCGATAHAGHNASSCAPLGRVSRLQKGSERKGKVRSSVLLGFCLGEQAKGRARCLQHLRAGVSLAAAPSHALLFSLRCPFLLPPPRLLRSAVLLQSPQTGSSVAALPFGAQLFSPCCP